VSSVLTSGSVGGTITISFSDTGFPTGGSPAGINIVPSGIGTAVYRGFADNSNAIFGQGVTIASTSSGGFISGPGATSHPFSLTLQEQVTLPPGVGSDVSPFNNDFKVEATPNIPLALSCGLSSGQTNTLYSSQLSATGGVPPYSYSIAQGSILPLTLDPITGAMTGTPTTATVLNFIAQVVDSSGVSDFNNVNTACSITITAPAPSLSLACPSGTAQAGVAYNGSLTETGGTFPFTFSLSSGALPVGLFLNASTGAITGTPSQSGSATFVGKVVDSTNPTKQTALTNGSCNMSVAPPPAVVSTCVTINAVQNQPILAVTMMASGGMGGPYSFSATGLPTGLSMASDGTISGTPTVGGTFNYQVTIHDVLGNIGTLNCSLTVTPVGSIGVLVWNDVNSNGAQDSVTTEPGLSSWTVRLTGAATEQTVTSGTGNYIFQNLTAGTYTVCVDAKAGYAETYDFDGLFSPNCATVVLGTGTNLTNVNFGYVLTGQQLSVHLACPSNTAQYYQSYSSALIATGGIAPYTYSITAGSLPLGLFLNGSTGAITGTPTQATNATFTAKVVDSEGTPANTTASCNIGVYGTIGRGDAATIGFWHNKNGQTLIKAATPATTGGLTLANWLATSYPYLYGSHAAAGSNLTNASNATVAALFMTYFNGSSPKTSAQIMAGALAGFFTNSTLSKKTAVQFGFNYTAGGTGSKLYNIGSYGTAIGLPNYSYQTVAALLNQVNVDIAGGTYTTAAGAFNVIFNGINTTGDIQ
jgi:large repetitive protein